MRSKRAGYSASGERVFAAAVALMCCLAGIVFWISVYSRMTASAVSEGEIARALAACEPSDPSDPEKLVPALRREPTYPAAALRRQTEGYVQMSLLVAADGRVSEVDVEISEPAGVFDEVSIQAAQRWRYCPRQDFGSARVRLDFTLGPAAGADDDPCGRLGVPFDEVCRMLLRRGRPGD